MLYYFFVFSKATCQLSHSHLWPLVKMRNASNADKQEIMTLGQMPKPKCNSYIYCISYLSISKLVELLLSLLHLCLCDLKTKHVT